MAVRQLKRVYLIAHSPARDALVSALQDAAIVHLEPLADEERAELLEPLDVDTRELDRRLGEFDSAIDALAPFAHEATPPRGEGSQNDGLTPSLDEILTQTRETLNALAEIEVRRGRLANGIQHLNPWASLPIPVEWLGSTPTTAVVCGTLPARAVPAVRDALAEQGTAWILEEVGTMDGKAQVVMADLIGEPPDAERLLREAGFQPMLFPLSSGTVAEMIQQMQGEVARLDEDRIALQGRLRDLAAHRGALMAAYDETAVRRQRLEALQSAARTKETVILTGWAAADEVARLDAIAQDAGSAAVLSRDPRPGEDPPVILENTPLVEPCQAVTGLYGMPRYREIDPTPLLAPFFVACFGIAVGEGGYGVILAVLSKLAGRFLKLGQGAKRMMNLLFYCGITTFVAGVLMGSFFAIDFTALPPALAWAAALHDRLVLLDPMKQPLPFLGFVLALGFLQVWTGVLIGAVVQWRSGQRTKALLYSGGWLTLLPFAALLFISPVVGGIPVRYVCMAAAASVFIGAGLGAPSVAGRIGAGFFALYGITGFFGDILSYSRLFALGLATGVMASVINILASQAKNIPVIGWVLMVLILVFGHPVNLAINALGAFVHSARLQFVEFFTKFFEGGGRRFEPFARRVRYLQASGGKNAP